MFSRKTPFFTTLGSLPTLIHWPPPFVFNQAFADFSNVCIIANSEGQMASMGFNSDCRGPPVGLMVDGFPVFWGLGWVVGWSV